MDSGAVAINPPEADALPILESSEIVGGQRIPWGSNYTFLVRIDAGPGRYLKAIYKPRDGERPLIDFPQGTLYKREYAAFLLGRALGWPHVPLTLIRDGPYGIGSVQLYVESDPDVTYFELLEGSAEELLRFAVFDVAANNADRKGGHCLRGDDGRIWSIDHGLTFHPVFKMRTVMLEYWGAPIPGPVLDGLEALANRLDSDSVLADSLGEALNGKEIGALRKRLDTLLERRVVPRLDPRRNVPWPLV